MREWSYPYQAPRIAGESSIGFPSLEASSVAAGVAEGFAMHSQRVLWSDQTSLPPRMWRHLQCLCNESRRTFQCQNLIEVRFVNYSIVISTIFFSKSKTIIPDFADPRLGWTSEARARTLPFSGWPAPRKSWGVFRKEPVWNVRGGSYRENSLKLAPICTEQRRRTTAPLLECVILGSIVSRDFPSAWLDDREVKPE